MIKAIVENGVVTNCVMVDPADIPSFATDLPTLPDGFGIGSLYDGKTFTGSSLSLASVQASQIAALTASCAASILGGYTSSALGAAHTYPSGATNQINMLGSVTASLLPALPSGWTTPFWCSDSAGVWSFAPHTAAQIQQAGDDGKAWVVTCQTKLQALSASVTAAMTVADVQKITW